MSSGCSRLVPDLTRRAAEQIPHKPYVALLLRHDMVYDHLVGVGTRLRQPLRSPVGTLDSVHAFLLLVATAYMQCTHIFNTVKVFAGSGKELAPLRLS